MVHSFNWSDPGKRHSGRAVRFLLLLRETKKVRSVWTTQKVPLFLHSALHRRSFACLVAAANGSCAGSKNWVRNYGRMLSRRVFRWLS